MMTFNELCKECEKRGITVDLFPLSRPALVLKMNDSYFIAINNNLPEDKKTVCLLHEMAHIFTNTLYTMDTPEADRREAERVANEFDIRSVL